MRAGARRALARIETPRAAMAIPACGVGNPRVRRLASPHAAFYDSGNGNDTFLILKNFYADADNVLGKQFLDHLRPLYKAGKTAVKILLAADVVGFLEVLDAIEVEVIDGLTLSIGIFVDNGERRRSDSVLHAQCLADSFDERRLACPHLAIEGENAIFAHFIDKFLCRLGKSDALQTSLRGFYVLNFDFIHFEFYYPRKGVRPVIASSPSR